MKHCSNLVHKQPRQRKGVDSTIRQERCAFSAARKVRVELEHKTENPSISNCGMWENSIKLFVSAFFSSPFSASCEIFLGRKCHKSTHKPHVTWLCLDEFRHARHNSPNKSTPIKLRKLCRKVRKPPDFVTPHLGRNYPCWVLTSFGFAWNTATSDGKFAVKIMYSFSTLTKSYNRRDSNLVLIESTGALAISAISLPCLIM